MDDRVLNDPRFVRKTIAGHEYEFWFCRRGYKIAKHAFSYDPEEPHEDEDGIDSVLRSLWIAHLPFEPTLAFEDFEMRFLGMDYPDLLEAIREVNTRQTRQGKEEEAPSKKRAEKE